MAWMALEVKRDASGRVVAGTAAMNTVGTNQYSPRVIAQRRIDLAVVREISERPMCVASFAEQIADALEDPENHLDLLKLALDRVWPAVVKNELSGDSGASAAASSAEQWERLSEDFGSEIESDQGVVIESSNVRPINGAD
jgi:hypothetical protein